MFLAAAVALKEALETAKLAYVGGGGVLPHSIMAADAISPRGDNALPEAPYILVAFTQAQPGLQIPRGAIQADVLTDNQTRLAIIIMSLQTTHNTAAGTVAKGFEAQHRSAMKFVRDFILKESSINVPASYVAEDGDEPYDFRPDDGRFEGGVTLDSEGFKSIFFVRISKLEAIWQGQ